MCVKHWCFVECPGQGRLHISVFSQWTWALLSGPTVRKDNGGNDNITDAHKARAGWPKRSLSELITLCLLPICCFTHSWGLWRSGYSWIHARFTLVKQKTASWKMGWITHLALRTILKQALAFPLNRFLIISTNIARGSWIYHVPYVFIKRGCASICMYIYTLYTYIYEVILWSEELKSSRSSSTGCCLLWRHQHHK